jgi:hypothetical protein
MIHLKKDQIVQENSNLRVLSPTGDYNDDDLIECYDTGTPGLAVGSFQAQFVQYGNMVYRYNEQEELGREIIKLDPNSTHDSAFLFQEDEGRKEKRKLGKLRPENPAKLKNEAKNKQAEELPLVKEAEILPETNANASSTNPIDLTGTNQNSTTTPSFDTSTSTPVSTSTSTPTSNSTSTLQNFDSNSPITSTTTESMSTTTPSVSTTTPQIDLNDTISTTTSSDAFYTSSSTPSAPTTTTTTPIDLLTNSVIDTSTTTPPAVMPDVSVPTTTDEIVAMVGRNIKKRLLR